TVDGSHEVEYADNNAVELAERKDSKLTIVSVIDSRTYSSYEDYDAQFTEKSKNFSEDLLKGYKEVATNAGVTAVKTRLEFGSPKAIIPKKLAADVEADLIMCGTSGLNAVERFIVVSVSEAIVLHSPCDVLMVRTEELPEDFQPQVATDEFRSKYQA